MGTSRLRRWRYRLSRSFLFNLPLAMAAALWRRLLVRTTFIAITGSNGKTTTKELLAAILSSRYRVHKTLSSHNGRQGLIRTILATRPWHRYAVVEIGIEAPGQMWRAAWLTRPDIAIITGVGHEQTENFPSLEATASEKARLLDGLKRNGAAILNGDDRCVRLMGRAAIRGPCYDYGADPSFDLWADQIEGRWPERMRLRVHCGGQSRWVVTQFVGTQWAPPVLAALPAGRVCGVDLEQSLSVIAQLKPFTARLEPVELAGGAVLVRDEFNGSAGTTRVALQVLAEARARRRIAILRDVTDDDRPAPERLSELGRLAAASADVVIFLGPQAHHAARGAREAGLGPDAILTFERLQEAADWLRTQSGPGDLILLKGRNRDHLSRIYLDLVTPVRCWLDVCEFRHLCDECACLGPRAPHRRQASFSPPGGETR
jgi:UDP-N-acetylmuramoyl-tripeptide--D-alanyl-D-alanine ligase